MKHLLLAFILLIGTASAFEVNFTGRENYTVTEQTDTSLALTDGATEVMIEYDPAPIVPSDELAKLREHYDGIPGWDFSSNTYAAWGMTHGSAGGIYDVAFAKDGGHFHYYLKGPSVDQIFTSIDIITQEQGEWSDAGGIEYSPGYQDGELYINCGPDGCPEDLTQNWSPVDENGQMI